MHSIPLKCTEKKKHFSKQDSNLTFFPTYCRGKWYIEVVWYWNTSVKAYFAVTRPSLLNNTDAKVFLRQSAKNYERPTCQVAKNLFKKDF